MCFKCTKPRHRYILFYISTQSQQGSGRQWGNRRRDQVKSEKLLLFEGGVAWLQERLQISEEREAGFHGRHNNGTQRHPHPIHQNLWIITLQEEPILLISWPWDGEIILEYPHGPSVITRVFKILRGTQLSHLEWFPMLKADHCCQL